MLGCSEATRDRTAVARGDGTVTITASTRSKKAGGGKEEEGFEKEDGGGETLLRERTRSDFVTDSGVGEKTAVRAIAGGLLVCNFDRWGWWC